MRPLCYKIVSVTWIFNKQFEASDDPLMLFMGDVYSLINYCVDTTQVEDIYIKIISLSEV